MGPMFRHERPQKGRYRQFQQMGVEAYGMEGPDIDAELILLTRRLWKTLGIGHKLELQINSLGTLEERLVYREKLVEYFRPMLTRWTTTADGAWKPIRCESLTQKTQR